jgi:hypothetical protein
MRERSGPGEIVIYLMLSALCFVLGLRFDGSGLQLLFFLLTALFFLAMFRPRQTQ